MQKNYIDQALQMCELTEEWSEQNKFRWTCEATLPVLQWLQYATRTQVDRFKLFLNNGQMSISATYLHTTSLCTPEQMAKMLYPIKQLREQLGIEIKTAINHDVNGQPWPYSQMLLDAGVEFYIMGINIHFGGFPLTRPSAFYWQTPDKRELLTFNGEHYSLFGQICNITKKDTNVMAEGLDKYVKRIEAMEDYPFDFAYLTSTNLPMYDNNPPDRDLAELIKKWNEEGREPSISFVTPEQLYEKVKQSGQQFQVHAGDWTDYWNFGSGSAAKETKLNRRTKQGMKAVELMDAFSPEEDPSYLQMKKQAWEQINLYDEHTWGASIAISDPDDLEVDIQWAHKAHYAYLANSLTGYLLGVQLEKLAENPLQSEKPEGILLVNPSSTPVVHDIRIPSQYMLNRRNLNGDRMRQVLMNNDKNHEETSYGTIELPPFSWRKIPIDSLQKEELSTLIATAAGTTETAGSGVWLRHITVEKGYIETPYHKCSFDPITGRITSLYDKRQDWEVLNLSSPWTLFQYVQETIDPIYNPNHRTTLFPRDTDKGNEGISVWNHDWKAKRQSYTEIKSCHVERSAHSATLVIRSEAPGVNDLEQRFTFFDYHADIEMKVSYYKQDITTPEGTYFALPINIGNWRCHYDTAGQFVELDAEQLPGVSRDYITVDKSVSVYDGSHGVTLICPDAPLVQVGDFNFGKEQKSIDKNANPLLLAWPMNNYWDTNFRARQPGAVSFTYVLSTFQIFDPVAVMESAVRAVSPVFTTAAIVCNEDETGQFIQLSGNGVQIFDVRPSAEGAGVIVRLSNFTNQQESAQLKFPDRKILKAFKTNALEEIISEISNIHNDSIELKLEAKQMVHLLLHFEN